MKVFISYGSAADQVTALRLQALAVVNGLNVYVPPAYTRTASSSPPDPEVGQKLIEAEIILGIVGTGLADACRQELDRGIALHKATIVMADPVFEPQLKPYFGPNLVVIDPAHPDRAEGKIVEYLKAVDVDQNTKTALLALGTLALGLLIFAPTK